MIRNLAVARTFAMPAELLARDTPYRWAAVGVVLTAAGVALGVVLVGPVLDRNLADLTFDDTELHP